MMRTHFFLLRALLACALLLVPVFARAGCPKLAKTLENISAGITDSNRVFVLDWQARFAVAPEVEARGMLKAAHEKELLGVLETFRTLPSNANPLRTPEEVYRVIGQLTHPTEYTELVDGLDSTVRTLFSGAANPEKGALLDLKIADEILSNSGTVKAFQHEIELTLPDGTTITRRYDVSGVDGLFHENKNWLVPLSGASDGRLVHFADEFRRDILIHGQNNFASYRINLRDTVAGQVDIIKAKLLEQFSDPRVVANVDPDVLDAARRAFVARWDAGASGRLVIFY